MMLSGAAVLATMCLLAVLATTFLWVAPGQIPLRGVQAMLALPLETMDRAEAQTALARIGALEGAA